MEAIERPEEFGPLFHVEQDGPRLQHAMRLVRDCALGTQWWTLRQIEATTGVPQASASAHLRHLTRPEWGGYLKERRRAEEGSGLFEYRLRPPETETTAAAPPKPAAQLRALRAQAQQALAELRAGRPKTAEAILKGAVE